LTIDAGVVMLEQVVKHWFSALLVVLASTFGLAFSAVAAPNGRLRVLTYNVAGLPEGISRSSPLANHPLIGERLNQYDLALVQEDFAYARELREKIGLPYQSQPFVREQRVDFGDGLSVFSRFHFPEPRRTPWSSCHGITGHFFDCLTPKGFSVTTLELGHGVPLDVWNVHLDAGFSAGDRAARASQLEQLAAAVRLHSSDRALIVAGDFNLSSAELDQLRLFQRATATRDACRATRCPQPWRIDRVLFRPSKALPLAAARWRLPPGFVDARGAPLSDHAPVAVDFSWR
jgi:endonuclease/exonuclease/phosphatase family metal-dependent hydrolase